MPRHTSHCVLIYLSRRLGRIPNTVRRAQRTYGTTDPGGVWHPVHGRECLTILLRYLRRKWTMQSTDDDLHCIRYTSLLMPAYWQSPILSFSGYGATALEKNGCTHSLHSLDVHMYFTKLTQDIGVLEQRRNLSCMACSFHLLG